MASNIRLVALILSLRESKNGLLKLLKAIFQCSLSPNSTERGDKEFYSLNRWNFELFRGDPNNLLKG